MPTKTIAVKPLWVLLLTAIAQFVLQLDFSIVNVALATIQYHLHFSAVGLQWVVSGYALTFGSLLLIGGRLGDVIGHRRAFVWGLILFALSSLAGGLADSAALLVAARLVQGASAALVAPAALAMLTHAYTTPAARANALGIFQGSTAAGATAGIVLGGVLTQYLGWRWVLLVNPPIIAILVPLVLLVLPNEPGRARGEKLDVPGAVTGAASIAALILGVTEGQQHGFTGIASISALVAFAVLAACFVAIERRAAAPMVPGALLRDPFRRGALTTMFIVGAVLAGYVYFMTLYLQRVLGYSAVITGLSLALATLTSLIVATQVARRLMPTLGSRRLQFIALLLLGAGQLWLSRITADGSYVSGVLPGILLSAAGIGLALPATSFAITNHVPPQQRGIAGGMFVTAQQVGSAVGLAVLATAAAARTGHVGSLVSGYRLSYLIATGLVVLAVVVLLLIRPKEEPSEEFQQPAGDRFDSASRLR
jgi:EmrB/QacA subfamily drug resistance transporter